MLKLRKEDKVTLVFKNGFNFAELTITVEQLINKTAEDFYEMLEEEHPCTSASCNNESQNFCDCGTRYDNYEIVEVVYNEKE